jgi:EmrB/QacA subfamily drug resistance transporter
MNSDTPLPAAPGSGISTESPSAEHGIHRPHVHPNPNRRWWALIVIAASQLLVALDATVVNIALPAAQHSLKIDDVDRQWIVTAYTLAFGGLLLLGGRVADFAGRKKAFVIGLLGFAAASAFGGAAQNGAMLFSARALQGVFAAVLAPAALALITTTFTESKERARAFSVFGAISGGGLAIGQIVGGVLTEYATWRWCLLINVPFAVVAAIAAVPLVIDSRAEGRTRYDLPGAILGTLGLLSLVYGFTEAAKEGVGWGGAETIVVLTLAVVLLVSFVLVEIHSPNPLLPMRILLNRNRGGSFLAALLISLGTFAWYLYLTYYFQLNLHYSPLEAGLAFVPFSVGVTIASGLTSRYLPDLGPKPVMIFGLLMTAVGLFMFVFVNDHSSWVGLVLPGELIAGIGMVLLFTPLSSLALIGVHDDDAGVASAVLNSSQQLGGALGIALLSTIYASAVTSYLRTHPGLPPDVAQPLAAIHGYHVIFLIATGLVLAALVTVTFLVKAHKEQLHEHANVVGMV